MFARNPGGPTTGGWRLCSPEGSAPRRAPVLLDFHARRRRAPRVAECLEAIRHVEPADLRIQSCGSPELVASKPQVSKHGDIGRLAAIYERAYRTGGWSLRRRLASTWQQPLGPSAAGNVATVVKAYYLALPASENVSSELIDGLTASDTLSDSRRRRGSATNPLAPRKSGRRPRFLPDEFVEALFQPGALTSARDVMIVTWLHDGGIRVGGLCGLRFSDLHLMQHHPCGQRAEPHIHIVGRDDNPNGARAKAYQSSQ